MTLELQQKHTVPQLAIVLLCYVATAAPLVQAAPTAANDKVFMFHGKIQAMDATSNTLTLHTNKGTFVFSVTKQTKVSMRGRPVELDRVKIGQETDVSMKIGPGGKGLAISIDLGSARSLVYASIQANYGATTPDGRKLSGLQLIPLVDYRPEFGVLNRGIDFGPLRKGSCLLSVRPDGTVSNVEMLRSTGASELDERAMKYYMKWRFKPNSVAQVRMPAEFHQYRRY